MKKVIVFTAMVLSLNAFGAVKEQTRCGWISNPTPANVWLDDAAGTWIMSVQGGYQADGLDFLVFPPSNSDKYVMTNGSYGYFCGCVTGKFDDVEMKAVKVKSSKVKTLKVCLEDQGLASNGAGE